MRLDSSTGGLSPGSGSKEALVDWGGGVWQLSLSSAPSVYISSAAGWSGLFLTRPQQLDKACEDSSERKFGLKLMYSTRIWDLLTWRVI